MHVQRHPRWPDSHVVLNTSECPQTFRMLTDLACSSSNAIEYDAALGGFVMPLQTYHYLRQRVSTANSILDIVGTVPAPMVAPVACESTTTTTGAVILDDELPCKRSVQTQTIQQEEGHVSNHQSTQTETEMTMAPPLLDGEGPPPPAAAAVVEEEEVERAGDDDAETTPSSSRQLQPPLEDTAMLYPPSVSCSEDRVMPIQQEGCLLTQPFVPPTLAWKVHHQRGEKRPLLPVEDDTVSGFSDFQDRVVPTKCIERTNSEQVIHRRRLCVNRMLGDR